MTFNAKNLAKLISKAIGEVSEDDYQSTIQETIETYMKKVKLPGGKKTKAKKDPNAPKRGASGYILFSKDNRSRIKEENPDATFGELTKFIAEEWNGLSDKEKKPFLERSKKDKVRYEKELAKYKAKKESSEDGESEKDYTGMKVTELRDLLKERKLDSKGKKEELVERLKESDTEEKSEEQSEPEAEEKPKKGKGKKVEEEPEVDEDEQPEEEEPVEEVDEEEEPEPVKPKSKAKTAPVKKPVSKAKGKAKGKTSKK